MTGRIQIDWTRCDGHGLCAALLPHRVHLDKWGFPMLRDPLVPRGTDEEVDARHAIAACPALALRLEDTR